MNNGLPSEPQVNEDLLVIQGEKEPTEKLGRNDLCPVDRENGF